jgi:hypothetical protein
MRVWLRLEGFSVLTLVLLLYLRQRGSWLLFAILFLAPDLSMLGYLAGQRVGAVLYNIAHSYILPLALAAFAMLGNHGGLLLYVLIWFGHIGLDRALGYGLKYGSSFGHTHLGWIGKEKREEAARLR